ncbi:MAG: hypothetical protein JJV98_01660 [Desulfosarcina sp.]|nr:hypothetical protein [Desulfobacterales bacterium]
MNTTTAPPAFSLQPAAYPTVTAVPAQTSISPGTMVSSVLLASAIAIGTNMVDVKRGSMSLGMAMLNGLAKGTTATLILAATNRLSIPSVIVTAGTLAVAGFAIDHIVIDRSEKEVAAQQ